MSSIPDLTQSLHGIEPPGPQTTAPVSGIGRWWAGPLDVEGLSLGAVGAAATALNALTGGARKYSVRAGSVAAAFDSFGHLRIAGRRQPGFAPLSGFHRSCDGWVRVHANYPHHAKSLMRALGVDNADDVRTVLGQLPALEAERLILEQDGVAAAVRSRAEWLQTPMHAAAAAGPWIRLVPSAGGTAGGGTVRPRWHPASDTSRPLSGLRVLDLTRVIAGPTATRLLAALGADVLRIDPPGNPELPGQFIDTGFDKRSALGDLRDSAMLRTVLELAGSADVVVLGYRGGALDAFGLSQEGLAARHPTHGAGTAPGRPAGALTASCRPRPEYPCSTGAPVRTDGSRVRCRSRPSTTQAAMGWLLQPWLFWPGG